MRRQAIVELLHKVRTMRKAQKDYFTNRTQGRLHVAKLLELKVDQELEQILGELSESEGQQTTLL
jgi:hypothetical protein